MFYYHFSVEAVSRFYLLQCSYIWRSTFLSVSAKTLPAEVREIRLQSEFLYHALSLSKDPIPSVFLLVALGSGAWGRLCWSVHVPAQTSVFTRTYITLDSLLLRIRFQLSVSCRCLITFWKWRIWDKVSRIVTRTSRERLRSQSQTHVQKHSLGGPLQ